MLGTLLLRTDLTKVSTVIASKQDLRKPDSQGKVEKVCTVARLCLWDKICTRQRTWYAGPLKSSSIWADRRREWKRSWTSAGSLSCNTKKGGDYHGRLGQEEGSWGVASQSARGVSAEGIWADGLFPPKLLMLNLLNIFLGEQGNQEMMKPLLELLAGPEAEFLTPLFIFSPDIRG